MSSTGYRDTTKRDRTPTWQWVQRTIRKAYTDEEWVKIIRAMPPEKAADALIRTNPVPRELKVEQSGTFQLIIKGLENKVIEGKVIESLALDEHDPDE